MTREQLQRELGFSKSHTCDCISRGMPTDSVEAAKTWLETNTKRGKPGNRSKPREKGATAVLPVEGDSTSEDAAKRLQANESGATESINEVTAELLKSLEPDDRKKLSNQLADIRREQKQTVAKLVKAERADIPFQAANKRIS